MTAIAAPPRRRDFSLGNEARTDAGTRLVGASVLWLSLLLVTYWWADDGGVHDLGSLAPGMTSAGRLSGLVASVLLLAQVVLMARIPVLERAYGQDRLAHLHRIVGFTSFNLMLVHILTITDGYAAGKLADTPKTFWDLTVNYSGMLLAGTGTVFLVMTVATSVKAARRRLRYESWHLLHLYAYLGVGLALPHQLWTGQQFTDSATKTVFWWSAWGVAAAAILTWRVGLPVLVNLRHRLTVAAVVAEAPGVWSVHLTGRRLEALGVRAGQFFTWRFVDGPGWSRGNPYSLSASPSAEGLRITVAEAGDGSRRVADLQPGTRVLVEGPYGRLSSRARTRTKVAFIGAGVGITPLTALAGELAYLPGDAVYLERFTATPLFTDEVDELARDRGLKVLRLPGRRRAEDSWLGDGVPAEVDDLAALRQWLPDVAEYDVFLCGPQPWTELVTGTLLRAGLPEDQLHIESFAW